MENLITDTMEITRCPECGTPFSMITTLINQRREDGYEFYCPNGHSMSFTDSAEQRAQNAERERVALDTEVQRLIAENDRLRDDLIAARRPRLWKRLVAQITSWRKA